MGFRCVSGLPLGKLNEFAPMQRPGLDRDAAQSKRVCAFPLS